MKLLDTLYDWRLNTIRKSWRKAVLKDKERLAQQARTTKETAIKQLVSLQSMISIDKGNGEEYRIEDYEQMTHDELIALHELVIASLTQELGED